MVQFKFLLPVILVLAFSSQYYGQNCTPKPTPFTENFDGFLWQSPQGFTLANYPGSIHPCWQRDTTTQRYFIVGGNWGIPDHTTGSGQYITMGLAQWGYKYNFDTLVLFSPQIDLSNLLNPELSVHLFSDFDFYAYTNFNLYVEDANAGWINIINSFGAQNNVNNTWVEKVADLSAFSGQTIRLKFELVVNGFANTFNIDDLSIYEKPLCPKPDSVQSHFVSSNSCVLKRASGGAASWQVNYGALGFTPGAGIGTVNAPAISNTYTLTGLNSSTAYDIYVRDSCGPGSVSAWVGPITIQTTCNPSTAPITIDFDDPSIWPVGNLTNPHCWSRSFSGDFNWGKAPYSSDFYGPLTGHTSGGSSDMWYRASGYNGGATAIMSPPPINVSSLTNPQLQFWYHLNGNSVGELKIEGFNGTDWEELITISGEQQFSRTDPWKQATANLSVLGQNTVSLRFTAERLSPASAAFAIDDFSVVEAPPCTKPQIIETISRDINGIALTWLSGGATSWEIEYGLEGFIQGGGTIVAANTNPFFISGLNPDTKYDFYIRDFCGSSSVSTWEGPYTERTFCAIQGVPYFEDFDNSVFNYSGTTDRNIYVNNSCFYTIAENNYVWNSGNNSNVLAFRHVGGPETDHTTGTTGNFLYSSEYFRDNLNTSNQVKTALYTPYLDLSGVSVPELSFWVYMYGDHIDSLQIQVDNGNGYQYLHSIQGQQQQSSFEPWQEIIVSLNAYANDTVRLKFIAYSQTNLGRIAIDDISVHEKPACPKPTVLKELDATSSSVQIIWNANGATSWEIEYGASGFALGTGTSITTSVIPYTISALSAGTAYDIYVRASCGGSYSAWSDSLYVKTECAVFPTPYTEDFEAPTFVASNVLDDFGSIDHCWTRTTGYAAFTPGQNGTPLTSSGPDVDHTTGAGKFIYVNKTTAGEDQPSTPALLSPKIAVSSGGTPELRYWYHMFGNQLGNVPQLEVDVTRGNGFTRVKSHYGQQQTSGSSPWREAIVPLDNFAGDTIQVRFSSFTYTALPVYNVALDDISVYSTSPYPKPANVSISLSGTTYTVSWNGGSGSQWEVGIREAGTHNALTIFTVSGSNSYVLTGLISNLNYEVFVRSDCGNGLYSQWAGPVLTQKFCQPVIAPYQQDFKSSAWIVPNVSNPDGEIESCWSRTLNGPNWVVRKSPSTSTQTGPLAIHGPYIALNASSGNGTGEIVSTEIDIPTLLPNPYLFFRYFMFGSDISSFQIEIDSGNGFTNAFSKNGSQQGSAADAWLTDSINLNAYAGKKIFIKLRASNSGPAGETDVDYVKVVSGYMPCGTLQSVNITTNGNAAQVSYISTYPVKYEIVPLGSPMGSGTTFTSTKSPISLNGLNIGSSYELFLKEDCPSAIWFSDTIKISCPDPQSISISNITNNGASISLISGFYPVQLIYHPIGQSAMADTVIISSSPYLLSGLQEGTTYSISAKGSCNSNTSAGVADTFTTLSCDTIPASFSTSYFSGDSIRFTASTSNPNGNYSYIWDFGDGNSGTGNPAKHIYSATGAYFVTITIYDSVCGNSVSSTDTIVYCKKPIARANFTVLGVVGSGMKVQFDASQSIGNIIAYNWDFGDGSTGMGVNPIHTYNSLSFNYPVTLTVFDGCRYDTLSAPLNSIGIDEEEFMTEVKVYPNPFDYKFSVEWPFKDIRLQRIEVSDISGRLILRQAVVANEQLSGRISIETRKLSKGHYFIKVIGEHSAVSYPLIKN